LVAVRTNGTGKAGKAFHTSALCAAARHGRLEVVRLMLEAGADPSRADGEGSTPLMFAAVNDHLDGPGPPGRLSALSVFRC
jgi:hypothetical protein